MHLCVSLRIRTPAPSTLLRSRFMCHDNFKTLDSTRTELCNFPSSPQQYLTFTSSVSISHSQCTCAPPTSESDLDDNTPLGSTFSSRPRASWAILLTCSSPMVALDYPPPHNITPRHAPHPHAYSMTPRADVSVFVPLVVTARVSLLHIHLSLHAQGRLSHRDHANNMHHNAESSCVPDVWSL
ncbi:hypothetical protein BDN70DRAFT_108453 [Pholiota conissans]|uniref:Uncharacterized protein n=1 Tax=Pholiota conissans TaxID=109636 RepID=A0A9P5Z0Z7_9AGAR|nr:hypothetical protein BDN70DRAFT_108453 [Pholiota conissans]